MIQPSNKPLRAACRADANRGRIWRRLSGITSILAVALLLPAQGHAACKVNGLELPVKIVGSRAIATVGINGIDVPLVVDSGAFYSFLTEAAAEQLKLPTSPLPRGMTVFGAAGNVVASRTTVKQLRLLKGELPDIEFVVGGNEPGAGAMGLMGRNLLNFADTEYDLAHGLIRFMFPNDDCGQTMMAYWAGETPVSQLGLKGRMSDQLGAIRATGQLNGVDTKMMFDTGAPITVMTRAAASNAGISEAEMTPAPRMRGGGRGEAKAWTAAVGKFELGGETVLNSRMQVAEFNLGDDDMLLGIDFFLSHRIYVSRSQRRMYFTFNGGKVFALNTTAAAESAASASSAPQAADAKLDAVAYARRGAAFSARGEHARALEDLDKACTMEPEVAEHFVQRGRVHVALKQLPQALVDLDTALRLDPALADARLLRAALRAGSSDKNAAIEDLQQLDRTLPPQAHARLTMAQLYASTLNMRDKALPQWSMWIASHPNDIDLANALNDRCRARAVLGTELDQALGDCDAALDKQAKNPATLDSRALIHMRRGDPQRALDDYERALKIKPDNALSLYGRGVAKTRLGEAEAGRADMEAARKLLPAIDAFARRLGLTEKP